MKGMLAIAASCLFATLSAADGEMKIQKVGCGCNDCGCGCDRCGCSKPKCGCGNCKSDCPCSKESNGYNGHKDRDNGYDDQDQNNGRTRDGYRSRNR